MSRLNALIAPPLLIGALTLVVGCQPPPAPHTPPEPIVRKTPEQRTEERFTTNLQRILHNHSLARNDDFATGSLALLITVNHKNEVIDCSTEPNKGAATDLPFNENLAAKLISVCWTSVLPELPEHLFSAELKQTIRAPLVFPRLSEDQKNAQKEHSRIAERDDFFWNQLFSGHLINDIGIARFRATATPQGQVLKCEVTLKSHPLRRAEFNLDPALQARLTQACEALNVSKATGFYVDNNGVGHAGGNVEYTPWKNGLKKTTR